MSFVPGNYDITPVGIINLNGTPTQMIGANIENVDLTYYNASVNVSSGVVTGELNLSDLVIPVRTFAYFVLDNGNKIYVYNNNNFSGYYMGYWGLYDSNNQSIPDGSSRPESSGQIPTDDSQIIFYTILNAKNRSTGVTYRTPALVTYSDGLYNFRITQPSTIWSEALNVTPIIPWIAWDQLAGNRGQSRIFLAKIKSDSIGNISGANYGTATDFDRISQSADIVPILRNLNYNSPVKIAWAGVNYMTVELQSDQGLLSNQVKAVFKIYAISSSETTPLYTCTKLIFIRSTDHYYLSFVYNNDQQTAVFLPVAYSPSSNNYNWGNETITDAEKNYIWLWLQSSDPPIPDPTPEHGRSPYDTGTTDNGGSGGNDIPQDDIHNVYVPALGAMASGMFTVYCPTDLQLAQISAFLWSDSFIDNVKKYFNNASDNIIAFYVLPLKPASLQSKNFKIGNLENTNITQVEYLSNRFTSVNMGSLYIDKRWETYLDFSPFTKFNLYLPGVGVVALDTSDLMYPTNHDGSSPAQLGSTISLEYVIDLMTGVLVAYVKINGQIRYQFPGKVGYSIPLTGQNYTAMGTGFVTAMAGLAATIASGGTAAPFTAGAAAAGIVNAMKPEVYRSGNLSGDASMLSLKTPMLIRTMPNKPALEDQPKFTGAPSYKIGTLSSFSGFTQVEIVHLEGFSCTDTERAEIESLLKAGVIL